MAALAAGAAWLAAPVSAQHIPAPMGFLIVPLACGDPECRIRYPNPYAPGMMNSILDHSMVRGADGFWQYGSDAGSNGVVQAFNGEIVNGRRKASDPACIGGTIRLVPDQEVSPMTNSVVCGPGFAASDEHPGYDYRAEPGTSVRAAAPGRVLDLDGQPCYRGNLAGDCADWGMVGINHGNGYITQYGHLGRIDVRPGEQVVRGQTIGLSGRTAPKPVPDQVHFEVLRAVDGDYLVVDPYGWVGGGTDPLYSADRVRSANLWLQDGEPEDVPAFDLAQVAARPGNRSSAKAIQQATGPRVALVIGVSEHPQLELPNARNDAQDMAAKLRKLGFDVDLRINPDLATIKQAVGSLRERIEKAGPTSSALFFFAGHGVQSGNVNYLLPANAEIESEGDLGLKSISAATVLRRMREGGAAANILILDACRDMSLVPSLRRVVPGLAEMSAKEAYGTFIAYSTSPGSVADDGTGPNSPYTAALLREIDRRPSTITAVFENVRASVLQQTQGQQLPWESTSLIGPFYFRSPAKGAARTR